MFAYFWKENLFVKFGICYRPNLHNKFIEKIMPEIDFVEIMPDITSLEDLRQIKEQCAKYGIGMGMHCLKSSLFSPEGAQLSEIENYFYMAEFANTEYYSDHIGISHFQDRYLSSIRQIPYTQKNIDIFCTNYKEISKIFRNNVLIENITQFDLFKSSELTESQFIEEIVANTNVELLFDFTNMYVTARNNNIDFLEYCDEYPFEKVKVVHVSGLDIDDRGIYQDNHSKDFDEEVITNLNQIKNRMNPEYILVERDFNVITEKDILNDVFTLKSIFSSSALI